MASLYWITIRQLTGRPRLAIIGLLMLIPILLGLVVFFGDGPGEPSELDEPLVALLLGAAVLPIITLTVSTAALGNDLEDQTLSNLTLSPIKRWKIALPKLAAAATVCVPTIVASAAISTSLAYDGDTEAVIAITVAMLLGALAYCALFLWLGIATGRALGFGLMYIFLWEFLFTSFVSGVRFLSVRAYMLGVVRGLDDSRLTADAKTTISLPVSLVVLAAVIVVFTLLTIRRLRTMDVP